MKRRGFLVAVSALFVGAILPITKSKTVPATTTPVPTDNPDYWMARIANARNSWLEDGQLNVGHFAVAAQDVHTGDLLFVQTYGPANVRQFYENSQQAKTGSSRLEGTCSRWQNQQRCRPVGSAESSW